MIEKLLERIAVAVEAIAKQKPGESAQADTSFLDEGSQQSEPSYSVDDVREALKAYMDKNSPADAKKLLEKYGAAKVGDLAPEKFAALIQEAK